MAYDLTAASDGTARSLGNKLYLYNATKARWERTAQMLWANVSLTYSGKDLGSNYNPSQFAMGTVTWNQPVTSFGASNIVFSQGAGTIYNSLVSQDPSDPKTYTFQFQISGAVGQFYIVENSVTTLSGLKNNRLYSEAMAGVYKSYPILSIVSKASTTYPVYSFSDAFFPGTTRFFVTSLGTTVANGIRIKTVFVNSTTIPISSTGSYLYTDITKATVIGTAATTIASGMYNATTGTGASQATDLTRYTDMYLTSTNSVNSIFSYIVNKGAYADSGTNAEASVKIYLGYLPTSTVSTTITQVKAANALPTGIKITFDHFVGMLNGGTLPSMSVNNPYLYQSGAALGNLLVDKTDDSGASLTLTYTPASSPTDYVDTLTLPAGWATFNGTTGITKDPVAAANAFTTRTSASGSLTIPITRSAVPVLSISPTNGSTNITTGTVTITLNSNPYRTPFSAVAGKYYYVYSGDSASTLVALAQAPAPSGSTVTITVPASSLQGDTLFTVSVDAGAYIDTFGNTTPAISTAFRTAVVNPNDAVYSTAGSYTFTVPALVTKISVVAVGAGGDGQLTVANKDQCCNVLGYEPRGGNGGTGGSLTYANAVTVVPGETLTVEVTNITVRILRSGTTLVGANSSYFTGYNTGGTSFLGGLPGNASGGGGGAGGYAAAGGTGGGWNGALSNFFTPTSGTGGAGGGGAGGHSTATGLAPGGEGGGVGLYGLGTSGSAGASLSANGSAGSGGTGKLYGGGGRGSGGSPSQTNTGGPSDAPISANRETLGGGGALRIVWGLVNGTARAFPSTYVSSSTS